MWRSGVVTHGAARQIRHLNTQTEMGAPSTVTATQTAPGLHPCPGGLLTGTNTCAQPPTAGMAYWGPCWKASVFFLEPKTEVYGSYSWPSRATRS
jgi:hypothetical protein